MVKFDLVGFISVAALLAASVVNLALWHDGPILLSAEEEASTVAAGYFSTRLPWPNDQCSACLGHTRCDLTARDCVGSGGSEGCAQAIARRRCEWSYWPWDYCTNNVGTCGSPMQPYCIPDFDPAGGLRGCDKPPPDAPCVVGGAADCNGC